MKTYKLIGKRRHSDISFTVEDLIPVKHKKEYSYMELVKLIDYSQYRFSDESFEEDYTTLYKKEENQNVDFFKTRGTYIIVIPGNHIYPTTLKEKDIQ